jgi:hypothetical protein
MGNEVFVAVESKVVERVYKNSSSASLAEAGRELSSGRGVLAYMGRGVRIMYGISYHSGKYAIYANLAGLDFLDEFDSLQEIFDAYALDYSKFRVLDLAQLNIAALQYRAEKAEATSARTNYDG